MFICTLKSILELVPIPILLQRLIHSEKLNYELDDLELISHEKNKPTNKISNHQLETKDIREKSDTQSPQDSTIVIEPDHIIFNEKSPLRRRLKIKDLFERAHELTRGEIAKTLKVTPATIASDLKMLESEGYIKKIKPSASTRTHYFQLIEKV